VKDRTARLAEHCQFLVRQGNVWEGDAVFYTAHETSDGSVYLRDIGLPVEMFSSILPSPVLLARMLPPALAVNHKIVVENTDPGFFGWVFRTHAWAVDRKTMAEARRDRRKNLSKDPDRKLAVTYNAATIDKAFFIALNVRGDKRIDVRVSRPNIVGQYPDGNGAEQQLPVSALLAACEVMKEIGAIK
jgi:hypothetical protein